jgi:hypothetical protein
MADVAAPRPVGLMSKDPSQPRLPVHSASTATSANIHAEKAGQVPAKEASDGACYSLVLLVLLGIPLRIGLETQPGFNYILCFQPAPNTPNTRPLPFVSADLISHLSGTSAPHAINAREQKRPVSSSTMATQLSPVVSQDAQAIDPISRASIPAIAIQANTREGCFTYSPTANTRAHPESAQGTTECTTACFRVLIRGFRTIRRAGGSSEYRSSTYTTYR